MQEHDEHSRFRRSVIPYVHCVLYCLRSQEVESRVAQSEPELVLCLPWLGLAWLGFTYSSLLYLKGGVYIAVGSPTDGPSDVV